MENKATTCKVEDGDITITLRIAFSGADDSYINHVKNEIESVWNGSNGYQTYGKYRVKFKVETMKITGYHCIIVTPYHRDLPRDKNGFLHVGYMFDISQGGESLEGWWSDQMSRLVEGGNDEKFKDFAHEAGHMMGLAQYEDNGIMRYTCGPKAKPTQANIEKVVENICGAGMCSEQF